MDIGCGGGHLGLTLLKKTDMQGYFIDINEYAVEKTKIRAEEWKLKERTKVYRENVEDMSFDSNKFDLLISRGSIGFWKDIEKAFREIYRVLKPGGKTYIGGGFGNKKYVKEIHEKMKKIDPEWPNSLQKERGMKKRSTEEYLELFYKLKFKKIQVIKNEEKGRWFIIEK